MAEAPRALNGDGGGDGDGGSESPGPDTGRAPRPLGRSGSRGRFIVLEGVEGSGKSTQAIRLAAELGAVLTREPGGTPLGERLRTLVLDRESPPVAARAEALLMLAARAQHVEDVIAPALRSGRDVVCDRFSASTIAYQGYGRRLETVELARLSEWAAAGVSPDRVILLDVGPGEVARRLVERRKEARTTSNPELVDRIEAEEKEFFLRVAGGFATLARSDPVRWRLVDGLGSFDEVAARVLSAARDDDG